MRNIVYHHIDMYQAVSIYCRERKFSILSAHKLHMKLLAKIEKNGYFLPSGQKVHASIRLDKGNKTSILCINLGMYPMDEGGFIHRIMVPLRKNYSVPSLAKKNIHLSEFTEIYKGKLKQ